MTATVVDIATMEHALYRFFADDGTLLYVGITLDPGRRWKEHAGDKPWWHEVASTTIERFPGRASVEAAERAAIITERPRYNVTHNRGPREQVVEDTGQFVLPVDTSWFQLLPSRPLLDGRRMETVVHSLLSWSLLCLSCLVWAFHLIPVATGLVAAANLPQWSSAVITTTPALVIVLGRAPDRWLIVPAVAVTGISVHFLLSVAGYQVPTMSGSMLSTALAPVTVVFAARVIVTTVAADNARMRAMILEVAQ